MPQPSLAVSSGLSICKFGNLALPNGQGVMGNVSLNDGIYTFLQDFSTDESNRQLGLAQLLFRGRGAYTSDDFKERVISLPMRYREDATHLLGQFLAQLTQAGEQQLTTDNVTFMLAKFRQASGRRMLSRTSPYLWDFSLDFVGKSPWFQDLSPTTTNLLTANQASLESGTTGWAATTNCTISQSATFALDGANSLRLSSTAGGDMQAETPSGTSGIPVIAGNTYTITAFLRGGAFSRSVQLIVKWWQASGAACSPIASLFTGFPDAVGSWSGLPLTVPAPADAAFASIAVKVLATGGAAELHYVDEIGIWGGAATLWTAPIVISADAGQAFNLIYPGSVWCEPVFTYHVPVTNAVAINSIQLKNTMSGEFLTVNFLSATAITASTLRDVVIDCASSTAICTQTGEAYDVTGSFPMLYPPAGQVNPFSLITTPASGSTSGCTIAAVHSPRWQI